MVREKSPFIKLPFSPFDRSPRCSLAFSLRFSIDRSEEFGSRTDLVFARKIYRHTRVCLCIRSPRLLTRIVWEPSAGRRPTRRAEIEAPRRSLHSVTYDRPPIYRTRARALRLKRSRILALASAFPFSSLSLSLSHTRTHSERRQRLTVTFPTLEERAGVLSAGLRGKRAAVRVSS